MTPAEGIAVRITDLFVLQKLLLMIPVTEGLAFTVAVTAVLEPVVQPVDVAST